MEPVKTFTVTNKSNPLYYLKALVSLVLAILTALAAFYGDEQWYGVVLAVLTAIATYVVPNAELVETGRSPE